MDAERNGLDAAWPAMCRGMKESFCALVHNARSLLDTFKCFQPQETPDGGGDLPRISRVLQVRMGAALCTLCNEMCERPPDPLTSILS